MQKMPTVFISYSWDTEDHINWVLELAGDLQEKGGVRVIVDKVAYDRKMNINAFMLKHIHESDYVLIICTSSYKKKAEALTGSSVGVETIISLGVFYEAPEKFIPILKEKTPTGEKTIPNYLYNYKYYDFTQKNKREESFNNLVQELWGVKEYSLPELGKPPIFQTKKITTNNSSITNKTSSYEEKIRLNLKKMESEFLLYFDLEKSIIDSPYIPLSVSNEPKKYSLGDPLTNQTHPINEVFKKFINDPSRKIWLLLGDYGCGKTAFCQKMCIDLLYRNIPLENDYLPIYLAFRNVPKINHKNISLWFTELLNSSYGYNDEFRFSWEMEMETLSTFMKSKKVVLILDGFDEAFVDENTSPEKNYNEIVSYLSTLPCKTIITSRPNYFISLLDIKYQLYNSPFSNIGKQRIKKERKNVMISFFTEFSIADIYIYLTKAKKNPNYIKNFISAINQNSKVFDVVSKPIFTNLILQYDVDMLKNEFLLIDLFEDIVLGWVRTGRDTKILNEKEMILFLEELAFFMFISNDKEIHINLLKKHLSTHFPHIHLEKAVFEITNCSFLVKSSDYTFTFSHNTFMEFLIANKLFKELQIFNNTNFYVKLLTDPINQFATSLIDRLEKDKKGTKEIHEMVFVEEDQVFNNKLQRIGSYYIDKYPTTNKEYREFLLDHENMIAPTSEGKAMLLNLGERKNVDWFVRDIDGYLKACEKYCWDPINKMYPEGEDHHPVIYVSYYDAWAYANYKGKSLPNLLEWIKAAGWDKDNHTLNSFGISPVPDIHNCNFAGHYGNPISVYSFPKQSSTYNCKGMAGNVSEWTTNWYDQNRYYKMIAGGSWHTSLEQLKLDNPSYSFPNLRRNFVGFRCIVRV